MGFEQKMGYNRLKFHLVLSTENSRGREKYIGLRLCNGSKLVLITYIRIEERCFVTFLKKTRRGHGETEGWKDDGQTDRR